MQGLDYDGGEAEGIEGAGNMDGVDTQKQPYYPWVDKLHFLEEPRYDDTRAFAQVIGDDGWGGDESVHNDACGVVGTHTLDE